jgi:hypothetical protein
MDKSVFFYLVIFIQSVIFNHIYAQKEDYIWIFGDEPFDIRRPDRAADSTRGSSNIDFNYEPPRIYYVPNRFLDFGDCNTSICDGTGQLLAYSNGQVIYNGHNKPIADTINYSEDWEYWNLGNDTLAIPVGLASPKSAIIIPFPGYNDRYIIFYQRVDRSIYFTDLTRYSIFEVTPDGASAMMVKDAVLAGGELANGALAACRHGNGRDWWLVQPMRNSKDYKIFLINPEGITLIHEISIGSEEIFGLGSFAFSPDGNYYAMMSGFRIGQNAKLIKIGKFDRCTGLLTNVLEDRYSTKSILAGVSFSMDSRYVYACENEKIFQYDLKSSHILGSKLLVAEYDGYEYISPTDVNQIRKPVDFCYMGTGPDGRIYISPTSGSTRKMGVIEYPHEKGEACEVRQHSIHIPTNFTRTMPNFPTYRLGPKDGSPCDTLGLDNHPVAKFRYAADTLDHLRIRFTDLSYYRPESWSWDFGDGSPKVSERYPFHRYAQNGTYNVCLTVSNENSSHTTCRTITIGTSSSDDVQEPSSVADITLYPNPVVDDLLLTLGEYIPEYGELYLYDMTGRQVRSQRIWYGQNSVDMSRLQAGMYVVRITDKGRWIRTVRVVKGE